MVDGSWCIGDADNEQEQVERVVLVKYELRTSVGLVQRGACDL